MASNIRWPKKGDMPFVPGGAFESTSAQLDWLGFMANDEMYALGFREAADAVVAYLESGADPRHPDHFFFPVTYLYRHGLELEMKALLRDGKSAGLTEVDADMLTDHNLHKLWNKVREMLKEMYPDGGSETLNAVERIIREFHKVDPNGQCFRYAHDRNGNRTIDRAPKLVDLQHLRDTVAGVFNFLDGCSSVVAAAMDYRRDVGPY
jgi:hypothetical protein